MTSGNLDSALDALACSGSSTARYTSASLQFQSLPRKPLILTDSYLDGLAPEEILREVRVGMARLNLVGDLDPLFVEYVDQMPVDSNDELHHAWTCVHHSTSMLRRVRAIKHEKFMQAMREEQRVRDAEKAALLKSLTFNRQNAAYNFILFDEYTNVQTFKKTSAKPKSKKQRSEALPSSRSPKVYPGRTGNDPHRVSKSQVARRNR